MDIKMTNAQFAIWLAKQEAPQIQNEVAEKVYKWLESKDQEQEPGWVDPMEELFDWEEAAEKYKKKAMREIREEREEERRYEQYKKSLQVLNKKKEEREEKELIKKILADPRNADGFADFDPYKPKYRFEGYTYILNHELTRIIGVEVPAAQVERHWLMEDLKEREVKKKK